VQSYRGAQIFEAIGLSKKLVAKYFTNTVSRLHGRWIEILGREAISRRFFLSCKVS
jgi:glutamate synthase (NADPH/NADH) large chain